MQIKFWVSRLPDRIDLTTVSALFKTLLALPLQAAMCSRWLRWSMRSCAPANWIRRKYFCRRCCDQIQITPTRWCCRARFSSQKMTLEQAVKSFRAAIERQPKNMAGYQALADFYVREKNNDEALKVIRAALQQQPDSFAMHLKSAAVMVLKGDYEAAIAEYEFLLKQNPGSLIVANNLASLLSDHRTDKASLERAYSIAAILRKSSVPSFKIPSGGSIIGEAITRVRLRCLNKEQLSRLIGPWSGTTWA